MAQIIQNELTHTSPRSIRHALRDLWASEALNEEAVIRARTHNLVVYTIGGPDKIDATAQQVSAATARRPGRVILVQADPDGPAGLDCWVTTYCQVTKGRQVCGELVALAVGGDVCHEIHSTVISLLAPDLPVYLWWMVVPDLSEHLFAAMRQEADRVLVDSDTFDQPARQFKQLAALGDLPLADLAWDRLTPWRRFVAQFWDAPDLRQALEHIRTLDVNHVASGDLRDSQRALLLVGWLADRLGWELASAQTGPTGGYITTWRKWRWTGKVEIVETTSQQLPPGEISGVFVQAGDRPPFAMPRVQFVPERGCVELRLNDASPAALRSDHLFTPMDTATALVAQLDLKYDLNYQRALRRAVEIVVAAHADEK